MANPVRSYRLGTYDEATRSVPVIASTRNPVKGWEPPKDQDSQATPRLESLDSWDLRRFEKNPVILWQHSSGCSAIGLASEVRETERGLEMRINFAAAKDEPMAEEAIKRVRAGLVRGVSVGFEYGTRSDEVRDGRQIVVFRKNILSEASLVTIPADEDALAGDGPDDVLSEEDERRARATNAGRELAKHRHTRTDGEDLVDRFDSSPLGKFQRTQVGGLRIPARIARTGILVYRNPDGSVRSRELRLAEEVFRQDSLDTLAHAPVTRGHRYGMIDPHNWKAASLGHVDAIREDGKFVGADLLLNDADAIAAVERRELSECSAGYRCRLERTSGEWNGERYDAIQRDITYNHVAVLPPGGGRAGADVGLRFDSNDDAGNGDEEPMSEKIIIKMDGKDLEYGSKAHIEHLESRFDAAETAHKATVATLTSEKDALQGRLDASESAAKKAKVDAEALAEKEKKEQEEKSKRKRKLRRAARNALRALEDIEDDEDEDKMDALEDELDALSDRDVMIRVLRADSKDLDLTGKSDDYIQARFDAAIEKADEKTAASKQERQDGIDSVARAAEAAKRELGKGGVDAVNAAREANEKEAREAHKRPLTMTKGA